MASKQLKDYFQQQILLLEKNNVTPYLIGRYKLWQNVCIAQARQIPSNYMDTFDYKNFDSFVSMINDKTPIKYSDRAFNFVRELHRAVSAKEQYGIDLFSDEPLEILSMSAGALGAYDALRNFNNEVTSTDLVTGGYIYQPMSRYFEHTPIHFNGRNPDWSMFEDNQFDFVTVYQAIEAYANKPAQWWKPLREMQRISRRGVLIVFNTSRQSQGTRIEQCLKHCKKVIPAIDLKNLRKINGDLPMMFIPKNK